MLKTKRTGSSVMAAMASSLAAQPNPNAPAPAAAAPAAAAATPAAEAPAAEAPAAEAPAAEAPASPESDGDGDGDGGGGDIDDLLSDLELAFDFEVLGTTILVDALFDTATFNSSGGRPVATSAGVDVYLFAAGLDPKTLDISIQQNLLTVAGERNVKTPEDAEYYRQERFSGPFRRGGRMRNRRIDGGV